MTAPGPFELATQLGVLKYLADRLNAARKDDLGPQVTSALPPGSRLPVMVGGEHLGWLSIPQPRTSASVTGEAAFLAWVKENFPTEVVTVALVRPSFADNVLKSVRERGGWVDKRTGELTEVPGVTVATGDPYPKVDLDTDTAKVGVVIAAAWRGGEIDLGGMLALPAAEGGEAA